MEQKCTANKCNLSSGAGKGDKPRNCFSKNFKENYQEIDWIDNGKIRPSKTRNNRTKYTYS